MAKVWPGETDFDTGVLWCTDRTNRQLSSLYGSDVNHICDSFKKKTRKTRIFPISPMLKNFLVFQNSFFWFLWVSDQPQKSLKNKRFLPGIFKPKVCPPLRSPWNAKTLCSSPNRRLPIVESFESFESV